MTEVSFSMSIITANVAPKPQWQKLISISVTNLSPVNYSQWSSYPMPPIFQQPKTPHHRERAKTTVHPFSRQNCPATGPTLLHSPAFALDLRKRDHLWWRRKGWKRQSDFIFYAWVVVSPFSVMYQIKLVKFRSKVNLIKWK